jgi:hypothetical protein
VPEPECTDSGLGNVMHLVRYAPVATRTAARADLGRAFTPES